LAAVIENPKSQIPNPKSQGDAATAEEYCRQLETYLCRKNDGHLIRIVGPAFEQVCGWAARGVPLKLAMRGIDRYFERYYAKGPRRRPVRIEFCEADVLDVFDEWRRAVGVSAVAVPGSGIRDPGSDGAGATNDDSGVRSSLPAHLERVIARLTALRAGKDRTLDHVLDDVIRELDAARAKAKSIRGDARDALIGRLHQLDGDLLDALRGQCDEVALRQLATEADEELRPFRVRMPADAYQQAHRACVDRLLRDRASLPTVSYE
jgi:hypothetical protein